MDDEANICPISREARCTPRRSVDLGRLDGAAAAAAAARRGSARLQQQPEHEEQQQQQQQVVVPPAPAVLQQHQHQQPPAAPAHATGGGATTTAPATTAPAGAAPAAAASAAAAARAKYLQPDGRLSLRGMMVDQEEEPAGARASSFRRQGSVLLRSKSGGSLSGSHHGGSDGGSQRGGGSSSQHQHHHKGSAAATWHASAAWAAPPGAAPSGAAGAAGDGGAHPEDAAACDAVALPPQVQLLASACWRRDTKALQQLLARRVSTAHALDAAGNTALHAVLLPHWQPPSMPALCAADAAAGAGSGQPRGGVLSCFTACFGQPATAAGAAAGHADGSTRAGSRAGSGRLSLASTAAAQLSMVSALLGACADANVRNRRGQTPLMLAALAVASSRFSAQAAAALRVLEALACHVMTDINMKDAGGRTALALLLLPPGEHAAAAGSGGSTAAAPAAAVSAKQQQQVVKQRASGAGAGSDASAASLLGGGSARDGAVAAAQLKGAHVLVHAGADPNAADAAGMTPLMHAAALPGVSRELLLLLLERGANPRQFDNRRRTALTHAVLAQGLQPVPALGADPRLRRGGATTCAVCGRAQASSSGGLIGVARAPPTEAPADDEVDGGTQGRAAPAALSARSSSEEGSGGAGGAGSSSSSSSNTSSPAAGCSSGSGDASACSFCGGGGGGSANTSAGLPPVPHPGHGAAIRALCSFGGLDLWPGSVNSRYPGLHGFTQLHIAMRRGDLGAVDMLLAAGADVNAQDGGGNSPLMYWPVAPPEPAELVEELLGRLLAQGADPNLLNNDGWGPLDLACELTKLGKVAVKPACVPVHATLVGWGARNSAAFKTQHASGAPLLCMRTDSSILNGSKRFGSIRAASTHELQSQVAALRHGA